MEIDQSFFDDLSQALDLACQDQHLDESVCHIINQALKRLRLSRINPDINVDSRGSLPTAV
ncbi:MAG: hypothetical protein JRJ59_01760 [Deltaproteobacteria bacterium]|nr:hypothetical protein [Deltaproteobacteria bacterium]